MILMKIEGLIHGPSPFDGQYLVEYDPDRPGVSPTGEPMLAHIITSPDPAAALRFNDLTEAVECWKQVSAKHPRRLDGRPNRPLTAFTVSYASEEEP